MATSISPGCRSSYRAQVAISDAVLSISRIQLIVFDVYSFNAIGSTTCCPNIMWNVEYPDVDHMVILEAQSTAGTWWIHIPFGAHEQAVISDSTFPIGLSPCLVTALAAA
jgi:hypothetical protein